MIALNVVDLGIPETLSNGKEDLVAYFDLLGKAQRAWVARVTADAMEVHDIPNKITVSTSLDWPQ